jgi:hypothetical protein
MVSNRELGAGVWAFAAHDQPGAIGPGIQVHQIGDLGHLGAVPDAAVGFAGGISVLFLDQQQGVANPAVDPVAEGEANVAVAAFLSEPVRRPGRVCPD